MVGPLLARALHPRFCCGDRYVVFTTTVRGEVEVAMAPTEELIERTE